MKGMGNVTVQTRTANLYSNLPITSPRKEKLSNKSKLYLLHTNLIPTGCFPFSATQLDREYFGKFVMQKPCKNDSTRIKNRNMENSVSVTHIRDSNYDSINTVNQ